MTSRFFKKILSGLILSSFALSFTFPAKADTIYLKDGRKYEGTIQAQDDQKVYIGLRMGVVPIDRDKIERIEKKSSRETPASPAVPLPVLTVSNRRLYKDGKLFYIKGINYGFSYGPETEYGKIPFEVWEKDFAMIRELGANTVRVYAPVPAEILDLAWRNDLMMIVTVVYPDSRTDFKSLPLRKKTEGEARAVVRQHKNHPAVLMWSIWNDAPWHWESQGNAVNRHGFKEVNDFLRGIYLAVKEEDKSRPVTASNILKLPGSSLGFDFLDVIGVNSYPGIGSGEDWFAGVYSEYQAGKDVLFLEELAKKHNKPVFIAEAGYSSFCRGGSQKEVIPSQIKTAGGRVAGIIIFQWADEWWKGGNPAVHDHHIEEHWGIVDALRRPKKGYGEIKELFNSIRTDSLGGR